MPVYQSKTRPQASHKTATRPWGGEPCIPTYPIEPIEPIQFIGEGMLRILNVKHELVIYKDCNISNICAWLVWLPQLKASSCVIDRHVPLSITAVLCSTLPISGLRLVRLRLYSRILSDTASSSPATGVDGSSLVRGGSRSTPNARPELTILPFSETAALAKIA